MEGADAPGPCAPRLRHERNHMAINPVVRRVLRTQYVLIRTPLAVLDRRVLSRLPDHSRVRTPVAHGLAGLDAVAGRLTSDHGQDGSGERTAQGGGRTEQAGSSRAEN